MEENEDPFKLFFKSCLGLIQDQNTLYILCGILYHCAQDNTLDNMYELKHGKVHDESTRKVPCEQQVRKVVHKKCTNKGFRFNAYVGNFDMNSVILDLGFDVNTLPKKMWEQMGKPKMVWYPSQLWLQNQCKIYPIGRFEDVEVNIDGVKSKKT